MALGLVEQVADTAGAHSDEHLDEFGAGNREKRHASLAGDCFGQEGLTGPGWPHKQYALGYARAKGDKLLGFAQEFHDLLKFLFRFIHPGDVFERYRGLISSEHARTRFPEREGGVVATLSLAKNEPEYTCQDYKR